MTTKDGVITADQMRSLEQAAIDSGAVTGLELMERAGQGVVEAVLEEWPDMAQGWHRAVVLCGPGNNGGDGFVVARLLADAGWTVHVYLYGDVAKLPPDARENHDRWSKIDKVRSAEFLANDGYLYSIVAPESYTPQEREQDDLMNGPPDLFVDALFGIGLSRPLQLFTKGRLDAFPDEDPDSLYQTCLMHWLQLPFFFIGDDEDAQPLRSVAIDIPSGICSDTGTVLMSDLKHMTDSSSHAFNVDICVTFHRKKVGHVRGVGAEHYRNLVIKDIGL